jgi:hypothetical protein
MSTRKPPVVSNPTFYVNEQGNDFTFLLDAAENLDIDKFLTEISGAGEAKNQGSFAGEIAFRNLMVEAEVEDIEDAFWAFGKKQAPEPLEYLCAQIAQADAEIVKRFREKRLKDDEKLRFKKILNQALRDKKFNDLPDQVWIDPKTFRKNTSLLAVSKSKNENPEAYRHLLLEFCFPYFTWRSDVGRALICRSHAGEYLSVTVRKQERKQGYEAKDYTSWEDRKEYLFSKGEYCREVDRAFENVPPQGLLVVTGSTNSLKSEIARGLIHLRLSQPRKGTNERPYHLVTFEDPIEKYYYSHGKSKRGLKAVALPRQKDNIDYTPRQGKRDAPTLERALQDALRQTPTVFYVGETRNQEDWPVLLNFAATGHLIVTTAHAGSLVEAMHKIFEACNVQTPGDRAEVAHKLFGLIHLRSHQFRYEFLGERPDQKERSGPEQVASEPADHKVEDMPENRTTAASVLLPAVWKHTDRGIAALISNGLASVLPEQNETASCLGRSWFIKKLMAGAAGSQADINTFFEKARCATGTADIPTADIPTALRLIAREWDLEGV